MITVSRGLYEEAKKRSDPEYCMTAVSSNVHALQYVKEQTPELCMAAVKDYWNSLFYMDKNFIVVE